MKSVCLAVASAAGLFALSLVSAGCGDSDKNYYINQPGGGFGGSGGGNNTGTGNNTPTSGHFDPVRAIDSGGIWTNMVVNGARTSNQGLAFWHSVNSQPAGQNVRVELVIYFGPYGGDDNTLAGGEQPYLFPNFDQGAENNRGPADYAPIRFDPVVNTNNRLWRAIINNFPTSGRFVYTVTRNGNNLTNSSANVYLRGLPNDSSYDAARQSLTALYDQSANRIILP